MADPPGEDRASEESRATAGSGTGGETVSASRTVWINWQHPITFGLTVGTIVAIFLGALTSGTAIVLSSRFDDLSTDLRAVQGSIEKMQRDIGALETQGTIIASPTETD